MPGPSGGSSTSQSSTNVNLGPWQGQQGVLGTLMAAGGDLFKNNQLTVPTTGNATQNAGWSSILNGANNQWGLAAAPGSFLTDQLSGKYLSPNSNPYLAGMENAAADQVTRQYQNAIAPQTASNFEMGNRYGSGAYQNAKNQDQFNLATGLSNLANNFYGNAYQTGVQNMFNAAGMAPQAIQTAVMPGEIYAGVGQQQTQRDLQNQMLPWQTAQLFKGLIDGNYGQTGTTNSTTTQPYYSNPFGSVFGGALSGLGIAGQLGWHPFGAGGLFGGAGGFGSVMDPMMLAAAA